MSDAFQIEMLVPGFRSPPAFVRVPEGSGSAEHPIRTPKEDLLWIQAFDTVQG